MWIAQWATRGKMKKKFLILLFYLYIPFFLISQENVFSCIKPFSVSEKNKYLPFYVNDEFKLNNNMGPELQRVDGSVFEPYVFFRLLINLHSVDYKQNIVTGFDNIKLNNYQEKVSDNIKNTIWIPEYYYKQLKTNNRNTIIFENEKYWKEFDGSAFKDGAVWTDVFECQSLLLSDYCFYISGNKWKYGISFFALIEEQTPEQIIYSVHKSYVNSCLYDKRYDSDYCFNKDLVYLLDRNKPFKIIFDIDGDYLKMYLQQDNKKEFIQTYVKTSAKALYQIEEWIKNKSNDLSEVSWPRHTEKSSEIDVIKEISAVQTNSATNIEKNKLMSVKENLKLRSGEATTTQVLTVMSTGSKVKVLELGKTEIIDGINSNWVKVEVISGKDRDGKEIKKGITGWCYGGYLQ